MQCGGMPARRLKGPQQELTGPDKTFAPCCRIVLYLPAFSCHAIRVQAGEDLMRIVGILFLLAALAMAQESQPSKPTLVPGSHPSSNDIVIPAGTKLPIRLKNTIST